MEMRVGIEAPSATGGVQDGRAPYLSHFDLSEPPFAITPDPRYLYMSAQHRDALAHLLYGVKEGGSFVQLTGEVGTGKTTLSRWLLEQTPPEVDVALVLNPRVTATELLAAVCDELKLAPPPGATTKGLVDALYAHLLEAHARGRRTLLIVDEAQDLEPEVLEQVRLLTNLETAKEKLLQVILLGQPELIRLLDQHGLRQLAQRITARYHLSPFSSAETASYIRHRLAVAGQGRRLFTRAAMRRIHRRARGIPRLINVICDRALLGAYAHDRQTVDAGTAERAAREVRGRPGPGERVRRWLALSAATAAAALSVAGLGLVATGRAPDLAAALRERAWVRSPAAATLLPVPGARPAGAPAGALASVLADPSVPTDRRAAFGRLLHHWRAVVGPGGEEIDCATAGQHGLVCATATGTWRKLRRLDVPAVLELATGVRPRQYATLVGLGSRTATLELGERRLTVPLEQVEAAWDGAFTFLWKPPELAATPIRPGQRTRDVAWLRARLGAPGGVDLYDDELRARVVDFQQQRSLTPDGIVGQETVIHLSLAVPDGWRPRLSAASP
jgi:general secretion pathway protein A